MEAERIFNEMKKSGMLDKESVERSMIVSMFIPDFFEEIATDWGYEQYAMSLSNPSSCEEIEDGSKPFFEAIESKYGTAVITEDGRIFKVKRNTRKTGSVTWNGDDEYYDEIETSYGNAELVDEVYNLPALLSGGELNADTIEGAAAELVSALFQ